MSGLGRTVIAGVIIAVIGLVVLLVALGMNGRSEERRVGKEC